MTLKLKLNDVANIKKFVDIASKYSDDITLAHGDYQVDAKSILGIFSMDLSSPVELNCEREIPSLTEELKEFFVA